MPVLEHDKLLSAGGVPKLLEEWTLVGLHGRCRI